MIKCFEEKKICLFPWNPINAKTINTKLLKKSLSLTCIISYFFKNCIIFCEVLYNIYKFKVLIEELQIKVYRQSFSVEVHDLLCHVIEFLSPDNLIFELISFKFFIYILKLLFIRCTLNNAWFCYDSVYSKMILSGLS